MRANSEIFREYDIRGIADRDLASPISIALGQAVGTYLKREGRSRITLARDCRLSSQRLASEVGRGLRMAGLEVIDIGLVPTPLLYFSLYHFGDVDGGVMITGSHNPADYNGPQDFFRQDHDLRGRDSEDRSYSRQRRSGAGKWRHRIPRHRRPLSKNDQRTLRPTLQTTQGCGGCRKRDFFGSVSRSLPGTRL